ncbi:microcin ABC transporter ATP-binding protein [Ensifer sp. Root31]|uniref:dipeptide ABC transporter ATP-binding protein n=1 Tax=Ensifer sp. Root31 TaxID=1736512 RepID=UPI00070F515E|nr:ABC transporter ATP-binding protein [Ensifer sp. Root31]KQU86347.1 microcin ABC transporter ATP-binding protein [Ensifer sp. Root31]
MASQAPVLSIQNLSIGLPKGGDRDFAVNNVRLDVFPGETVCLVGESGSGKSMTASAIMRLNALPATTGQIFLEGEDVLAASERRLRSLRGRRMSMIFQEPMTALNPSQRVGRQIAEAIGVHRGEAGAPKGSEYQRVEELFRQVSLPDPAQLMRQYPHRLSGGQRQRVMIAMALALQPVLIIADEPTTALDVTTQAQILDLLKDLQRRQGSGILFITHDFGVVADIADRIAVMRNGVIVEQGTRNEILNHPQNEYTQFLINSVPRLTPRLASVEQAPIVLSVKALTKTYQDRKLFAAAKSFTAVAGVDLALKKGQTLGIVGESGSGKSTAARCIARLIMPSSGKIQFRDKNLARINSTALRPYRAAIQLISQDPYRALNPRRTVGQSIVEGPLNFGTDAKTAYKRAAELLELVEIDRTALSRFPHQFSGGQRQRIAIARALAMDPDVLVADEAVSALDVSVQAQVLTLLEDIRDRLNLSMLFITHDLRVAARICDEIAVMKKGQIVEYASTTELFANPQHAYTRNLLQALPGRNWLL